MTQLSRRAGAATAGAAAAILGATLAATPAAALSINVSQSGGSLAGPVDSAGSGTLLALAQAAATVWEAALDDGGAGTVIDISVGWADIAGLGRTTATSSPSAGPGVVGAVNTRTVELATDVLGGWYLDPTPFDMTGEYSALATTTTASNGAGGTIEASRRHDGAVGDAAGRYDAFTVLIHEIAHAIGFGDHGASPFDAGLVEILKPGTADVFEVPLVTAGGGHVQALREIDGEADFNSPYFHSLLYPVQYSSRRVMPSQADVLTVAEIVGYQLGVAGEDVGALLSAGAFDASTVPLPAAGGLLAAGLLAMGAAGRRRRA